MMNKRCRGILSAWGLMLVSLPASYGHAVHVDPIEGGHGIRATYHGGLPVRAAEVRVWAPDDDEEPFQIGSTDGDGSFLFRPNTNGAWRVELDDGMGHTAHQRFDVGPDGWVETPHHHAHSHGHGLVTGVSIVFGLFGLYALWRYRSPRQQGT